MKGVIIANSTFNDRPASAFVKDGKLIDFLIGSKTTDEPIPGAIYRGVVGRSIKGLNGVFVDLGKTNRGYLKLSNGLIPGSTILVQVTTIALEDKAPTLTKKIIFAKKSHNMYWTLELASKLEDAPWPATKDELIDFAIRSGAPMEVVENLQELIEDEPGMQWDTIEDIWPDYPSKEDFFFNEDEY